METRDFILLAMGASDNSPFTPVQIQKLFFLLDKNIAEQTDGPHFDFKPYDYGPFDKQIYLELEQLMDSGLVEISISNDHGLRTYRLTKKGREIGKRSLKKLSRPVQRYIRDVIDFVCSLSFAELVSVIYKAYPEMRENSVFVQEKI